MFFLETAVEGKMPCALREYLVLRCQRILLRVSCCLFIASRDDDVVSSFKSPLCAMILSVFLPMLWRNTWRPSEMTGLLGLSDSP